MCILSKDFFFGQERTVLKSAIRNGDDNSGIMGSLDSLTLFLFLSRQLVQLSGHVGGSLSEYRADLLSKKLSLLLSSFSNVLFKHLHQVRLSKLRRGIFGG